MFLTWKKLLAVCCATIGITVSAAAVEVVVYTYIGSGWIDTGNA